MGQHDTNDKDPFADQPGSVEMRAIPPGPNRPATSPPAKHGLLLPCWGPLTLVGLCLIGGVLGCAEEETVEEDAAFYLRAEIDGAPFEVTSDDSGSKILVDDYTTAWEDQETQESFVVHAQSFTFLTSRPRVKIEAVGFFDIPPTSDEKFQILYEGTHTYGTLTQNRDEDTQEEPGINVTFWDAQDRDWVCSTSRGEQSSSTFEVWSHILAEDKYTEDGRKIWGEIHGSFSCTLYSGGGSTLPLVQGSFHSLAIVM